MDYKKPEERKGATQEVASGVNGAIVQKKKTNGTINFKKRKFTDPHEIEALWDGYYASKQNNKKEVLTNKGEKVKLECDAPVSIQDFCCEIGLPVRTFNDYCSNKMHREFNYSCNMIKQKILAMTMEGAMKKDLDSKFAGLVVKNNHDWKENSEHRVAPKGFADIKIIICKNSDEVKALEEASSSIKGEIIEAEFTEE